MNFVTEYRRKLTEQHQQVAVSQQIAVSMMNRAWQQLLRYHGTGRFGLR